MRSFRILYFTTWNMYSFLLWKACIILPFFFSNTCSLLAGLNYSIAYIVRNRSFGANLVRKARGFISKRKDRRNTTSNINLSGSPDSPGDSSSQGSHADFHDSSIFSKKKSKAPWETQIKLWTMCTLFCNCEAGFDNKWF